MHNGFVQKYACRPLIDPGGKIVFILDVNKKTLTFVCQNKFFIILVILKVIRKTVEIHVFISIKISLSAIPEYAAGFKCTF